MALSDLTVRQARTTGKRYTLSDNDCLGLMVSAAGGKSWQFRYYWLGKQKRLCLGGYPALSLREARAERDKAQALLARGIDPQVERDRRRHAARLAGEHTFKNVFDAWVEHRRKELKEGRQSTLSQILRIFNKDVLPTLGKMSIYDIRRPQLLGVLAAIEKRKAFTTAEKVRTWFNQLFRYALVIAEGLEVNPAADLDVVAEPKPPVAHNPYLHLPEMPEFLQKLRLYNPRGWQTQLGVRLLFLTGVRTGELRLAEPEQFDLDRGLWIIPPQVVKQLQDEMRKAGKRPQDVPPYIVPLSLQAIEIVRYLLGVMRPAQKYLLSHRSELKKRISENTLNKAVQLMGYEGRLTGHGIRGTISTALNEIGYPKIWVDAQLSHSDPNRVSSAYNHAKYVEPRRRMMQDWADRLDLLEQGEVEAASAHLTIRIDGVPAMAEVEEAVDAAPTMAEPTPGVPPVVAMPIVVTPSSGGITFQRLSQVPPPPVHAPEPEVSAIQREREEMLAIYESPNNLPVPLFGKLAGKSKDQINRELKAGKLLSITLGNRGQRVPDWQLVPLKHKLAQVLMNQCPHADSWDLYRMLTQPHPDLGDRAAIDVVTPTNVPAIIRVIMGDYQRREDAPEAVALQPIPENVRQSVRRLVDNAVVLWPCTGWRSAGGVRRCAGRPGAVRPARAARTCCAGERRRGAPSARAASGADRQRRHRSAPERRRPADDGTLAGPAGRALHPVAARAGRSRAGRRQAMIRIDALWLCTQPQDMRCGADRLLAVVVNTVGQAQAHHGWLFANARATRIKLLVHDGFGVWCATRRLHSGSFAWTGTQPAAPALQLTAQQFDALVVGLPWQRLPELQVIGRA